MIKTQSDNSLKDPQNKNDLSSTNETGSDTNKDNGDLPKIVQQEKPCGRSYSSAKALKDHIKTVHTDTNIYSCHVSTSLQKLSVY